MPAPKVKKGGDHTGFAPLVANAATTYPTPTGQCVSHTRRDAANGIKTVD